MNSRLDYDEFYVTLPEKEAVERAQRMVAQPNATFIAGAQNPLARKVVYPGPAKLLNVVVLLQESLGAEFVGAYGDARGLTPNIDRLAHESVVFGKTYATGTRTVRGMERESRGPGDHHEPDQRLDPDLRTRKQDSARR